MTTAPRTYERRRPLPSPTALMIGRIIIVSGPLGLLLAHLAGLTRAEPGQPAVIQLAVPLLLGWAAVLFLITRAVAPIPAWIGLIAMTVQLTAVRGLADGPILLAIESVGFIAFAIALWRVWWIPRVLPMMIVAFPVVDVVTPLHSRLIELSMFAILIAASLMVARRLSLAGTDLPDRMVTAPDTCSPFRSCAPGRTCCAPTSRVPLSRQGVTRTFM
ncbi:MAG: hypothetical protein NTX29_00575 [Actinobacteria bacterium]|nr:hypothetical protein [Actinomycetota bacterium]